MSKHRQRQQQPQQHRQRQQQQHPQNQFSDFASEDEDGQHEEYDPLANLLSLQLNKPAKWNLELSTTRSCSNIALPRILLYDQKGVLLLDADGQDEQTYRISTDQGGKRTPSEFKDNLRVGEQCSIKSLTPSLSPVRRQLSGRYINFCSHELSDTRRSSSLGGGVDQSHRQSSSTPQITPPLTTNDTSSTTGTPEKRRYRRAHSSGHRSILERFSMSRGRMSSPEYVQEDTLERAPRYFLRSSKAGTLVIKDESFSNIHQRRRRHKNSSNENMLSPKDTSPLEGAPSHTSRHYPIHQKQCSRELLLSTSEDEAQQKVKTKKSVARRN